MPNQFNPTDLKAMLKSRISCINECESANNKNKLEAKNQVINQKWIDLAKQDKLAGIFLKMIDSLEIREAEMATMEEALSKFEEAVNFAISPAPNKEGIDKSSAVVACEKTFDEKLSQLPERFTIPNLSILHANLVHFLVTFKQQKPEGALSDVFQAFCDNEIKLNTYLSTTTASYFTRVEELRKKPPNELQLKKKAIRKTWDDFLSDSIKRRIQKISKTNQEVADHIAKKVITNLSDLYNNLPPLSSQEGTTLKNKMSTATITSAQVKTPDSTTQLASIAADSKRESPPSPDKQPSSNDNSPTHASKRGNDTGNVSPQSSSALGLLRKLDIKSSGNGAEVDNPNDAKTHSMSSS